MELRIQLKICEGCGCLWYRALGEANVYCSDCAAKLQDFPAPETRRLPGRPPRMPRMSLWGMAEVVGGAE